MQIRELVAAVVVEQFGVRSPLVDGMVAALEEGPFLSRVGEVDIDEEGEGGNDKYFGKEVVGFIEEVFIELTGKDLQEE